MSPYYQAHFFGWFHLFFQRLWNGFSGSFFPDEIQALIFVVFASHAAILGSFLMMKRFTMMANAISHTMILGVVASLWCMKNSILPIFSREESDLVPYSEPLLFLFSTGTALFTSFLTQALSKCEFIREDAANAITFSSLFSLGITCISIMTKNAHVGIELMMGNPDALSENDIIQIGCIASITFLFFLTFFRGISVAVFDPQYGSISGLKPSLISFIIFILVSFSLVSSFRAVGFVMSLSFFILPPLIARLFSSSLKQMMILSVLIGVFSSLFSIAFSRHLLTMYSLPVSTGALAVVTLSFFYLLSIGGLELYKIFRGSYSGYKRTRGV